MNCNRTSRFLLLLVMLMGGMMAVAQQQYAFSVKECVDYAQKNNVQVKNALLGIKAQEQTNREIASAALPRVAGSVGTNYFPNVATQVFPNFIAMATYGVLTHEGVKNGSGATITSPSDFGYVNAQFGTKYNASAGVEVSQILFDGQVFVALKARDAAMELSKKTAAITEEQIKVNIYKLYFQLVAAKVQIGSLDANITRIQKLRTEAEQLYKNGFAEKLDLDKIDVTLTNLQTEKVKIDHQIETGYLALKFLMGMPLTDQLTLTEPISETELKSVALDEAFKYSDRKEMQQLDVVEQLGAYNVKRYQLSKMPSLVAFGQYNTNAQRNEFNFLNPDKKWFLSSLIGLKLSVPIFQGFAVDARVRKAQIELEQTKNNRSLLEQSIDFEVAQARTKYKNAIISMDAQKKNKALAENVYQMTTKKYGQGLGSNLEITNAQTELRVAENNYFTALYEAIIAKIDLMKATGKL